MWRVAGLTTARHAEAVEAVVLLDSSVPAASDDPVPPVRAARLYESGEAAMRAFRLIVRFDAPEALAAVLDWLPETRPAHARWSSQ